MKNKGVFSILLLLGAISGTFIGEIFKRRVPFMGFLGETFSIGFTKPLYLDLHFINLTFGISFDINLITIIGIVLVIIIFIRK